MKDLHSKSQVGSIFSLEDLRRSLRFEASDRERLKKVFPLIEDGLEGCVEKFYEYLISIDELKKIIETHSSVEKLKLIQIESIKSLFRDDFSEKLAENRFSIGLAHYRVGLKPHLYLSAYYFLKATIEDLIRSKSELQETELAETIKSLNKLIFMDMELAIESYNKRYNERIHDQARVAEHASRAKSEFLANMSHELRTPLNSIINFTEWSITKLPGDEGHEKIKDRLGRVVKNAEHLLALINDLLDYSKIEAGKMSVEKENFHPGELLKGVVLSMEPEFEKYGNKYAVNLPDPCPQLYSDRFRVTQILLNLLSNAGKFTKDGEITLTLKVKGEGMLFRVEDTGVGIAESDLILIFEKFKQAGNRSQAASVGTGLGLAITRHLVKLLGGEIGLNSELGKGTVFNVWLPGVVKS